MYRGYFLLVVDIDTFIDIPTLGAACFLIELIGEQSLRTQRVHNPKLVETIIR